LIETAYRQAGSLGLLLCCQDEAGPYSTKPYAGVAWAPVGQPQRLAHEYLPNGTAKLLTLLQPATGVVRVKGVTRSTNAVIHPWLKEELLALLATAAPVDMTPTAANHAGWERWQAGLSERPTLPCELPPLRMLLIWDNLAGHKTADMVLWLFRHGIMPLYTPLSGSWLNMAESIQRIVVWRALSGHHPKSPTEIIDWLETTANSWNQHPTPFVWGGHRAARRIRSRARRHALGGSGACTTRPIRRRYIADQWLCPNQVTH
jgi:hypothetical protein